jgi:hypothetical protein
MRVCIKNRLFIVKLGEWVKNSHLYLVEKRGRLRAAPFFFFTGSKSVWNQFAETVLFIGLAYVNLIETLYILKSIRYGQYQFEWKTI